MIDSFCCGTSEEKSLLSAAVFTSFSSFQPLNAVQIYLSGGDENFLLALGYENYELPLLQHMLQFTISLLLPNGLQLSALSRRHEWTPQDGSLGQKSWCQGCRGPYFSAFVLQCFPQTHCFDI